MNYKTYHFELANGLEDTLLDDDDFLATRRAEVRALQEKSSLCLVFTVDEHGGQNIVFKGPKYNEVWETHSGQIVLIVGNPEYEVESRKLKDSMGFLFFAEKEKKICFAKFKSRLKKHRPDILASEWLCNTMQQMQGITS